MSMQKIRATILSLLIIRTTKEKRVKTEMRERDRKVHQEEGETGVPLDSKEVLKSC